jgi:hypothetical protein
LGASHLPDGGSAARARRQEGPPGLLNKLPSPRHGHSEQELPPIYYLFPGAPWRSIRREVHNLPQIPTQSEDGLMRACFSPNPFPFPFALPALVDCTFTHAPSASVISREDQHSKHSANSLFGKWVPLRAGTSTGGGGIREKRIGGVQVGRRV